MKTKTCTKCKKEQPIENFHKFKNKNYEKKSNKVYKEFYIVPKCKTCIKDKNKLYREQNKEKIKNKRNSSKIKEYNKQYRIKNSKKIQLQMREWRIKENRKKKQNNNINKTRICNKCGIKKLLNEFSKYRDKRGDKIRFYHKRTCKQCFKPKPSPSFKFCDKCGLEKPKEDFYLAYNKRTRKGNPYYRRKSCKKCLNDIQNSFKKRKCRVCKKVKLISEFTKGEDKYNGKGYFFYRNRCASCDNAVFIQWKNKHRKKLNRQKSIDQYRKTRYMPKYFIWYCSNLGFYREPDMLEKYIIYRLDNKNELQNIQNKYKKFCKAQKKKLKEIKKALENLNYVPPTPEEIAAQAEEKRQRSNKYQRDRYNSDPTFKLRQRVSRAIRGYLIKNKSSKFGESILKHLPYSIEELKVHIESQFEPWMNWSNHGNYHKDKWNDNDEKTWTWSIDHIIPCSDLPSSSMEDENFKKCWSLENMRPYSAKDNQLDGATGTRHEKD